MTWAKYQPELFIKMAADGLSQDAAMAHLSAIGWLYQQERDDCRFPPRLLALGITPLNDRPDQAAAELVRAGYWARDGAGYELVDHADVIRQSLAAQWAKKSRDKKAQQSARDRKSVPTSALTSSPRSVDGSSATQASNHTSNHAVTEEQPEQFRNGTGKCRTCSQWEPLGRDWRCKSCAEWDVQEEAS